MEEDAATTDDKNDKFVVPSWSISGCYGNRLITVARTVLNKRREQVRGKSPVEDLSTDFILRTEVTEMSIFAKSYNAKSTKLY